MDPIRVNEASEMEMRVAWKSRSGTFFFLAEEDRRSLPELAESAGIDIERNERLEPSDPTSEIADGRWGLLYASSRITQFACHRCFEIYFSERELIGLTDYDPDREYPLEQDPYWFLAQQFRRACEQIKPEVAFMIESPLYATAQSVNEEIYPCVLDYMPESLIGGPYELLYIGPDRAALWDPQTPLERLTEIPVATGKLFFERYKPFHIEELTDAVRSLQHQIDTGQLSGGDQDSQP